MSDDCLFCKIAAGEIGELVFENEHVVAFNDINPVAPVHVLVIPKKHIATINDLTEEDAGVVGKLYLAAKEIAAANGLSEPGYRTTMNCNSDAGQTVFHIHLHLTGGKPMGWPPWPGA